MHAGAAPRSGNDDQGQVLFGCPFDQPSELLTDHGAHATHDEGRVRDPECHASGTDHTREFIPFVAFGPNFKTGSGGLRKSFADIGQTLATHLDIATLDYGEAVQ